MTDTTVKFFNSSMAGAPAVSGTAGTLVAALDACLVDGFGAVTLSSLVVAGDIATGTVGGGHNLAMYAAGAGPVIRVAGATPSALNGDWRLASVPDSTTFTFATTGIADQTATGTITAKRAPAGWEKRYSGTNKAVYARTHPAATAMLLRVDDAPTHLPEVCMYETMSDADTGTGPAPTAGTYYTAKSTGAGATARPWRLYADPRMFYFCLDQGGTNQWWAGLTFGDFVSHKSGDAYACALIAHATASVFGQSLHLLASSTGSLIARAHTQTGAAIASARYSHGITGSGLGGGNAYPNPVDNGVHAWPVEAWETTANARGMMPGLWNPIHPHTALTDGTLVTDIPQLPGRAFLAQKLSNQHVALFDLTGPWR